MGNDENYNTESMYLSLSEFAEEQKDLIQLFKFLQVKSISFE